MAVWTSLWLAATANWPLWRALSAQTEITGAGLVGLGAGVWLMILLPLALCAWRWCVKPVLVTFIIAAAVAAPFMGSYGVMIDDSMMVNAVGTDRMELCEAIGPGMLAAALAVATPPLFVLWHVRVTRASFASRLRQIGRLLLFVALAGLVVLAWLKAAAPVAWAEQRALVHMVNPLSPLHATAQLARARLAQTDDPPLPIGTDARPLPREPGQRPPLVLLVIGETARADHFSLNGYHRDTNPGLAARGAISFPDVTACGTTTASALPCLLSPLARSDFIAATASSENLVDLLQRAGLAVLWLSNQASCKGQCDRVPHRQADAELPLLLRQSLCGDGPCHDEALLWNLDGRLAALPADRRANGVVLILHTMGSHGPLYTRRSPAPHKTHRPECTSRSVRNCDPQHLINAYDNTIVYTDHVLSRAIDWLDSHQSSYAPSLLYVSDHGESLGENGRYLHGMPFDIAPPEQTRVPWVMWWPREDAASQGAASALLSDDGPNSAPRAPSHDCMRQQLRRPLTHDHVFHVTLGLAGVTSSEYRTDLDVVQPCRRPSREHMPPAHAVEKQTPPDPPG